MASIRSRITADGYAPHEQLVRVGGMNPGTWVEAVLAPVIVEEAAADK